MTIGCRRILVLFVFHLLVPQPLEEQPLVVGHFGILDEARSLRLELEARDGITDDHLLEVEGVSMRVHEDRLAVLKDVAGLEAPAERRVVGDHPGEDAAVASLAEPLHAEVTERIFLGQVQHGAVLHDVVAAIEDLRVRPADAVGPLEVFHLRTALAERERADERLEALVAPKHHFLLELHVLLHPGENCIERVQNVLGRVVDRLAGKDFLLQQLLGRLVQHARALAGFGREFSEREGILLQELLEYDDFRTGESGLGEVGFDTGGKGFHDGCVLYLSQICGATANNAVERDKAINQRLWQTRATQKMLSTTKVIRRREA